MREWVARQPAEAWQRVVLRDGTQGKIDTDILHHRVWLWDKSEERVHCWHLIVRREIDSPNTLKYSLSNAPENFTTQRLARMQAQRFWIERAFEDAKSECGMADYQVRKWNGWQHHMALVLLAMLFMLEMRVENEEAMPLLSCYDVRQILAQILQKRGFDMDEVMRQIEQRHRKRLAASKSAAARKRRRRNGTNLTK